MRGANGPFDTHPRHEGGGGGRVGHEHICGFLQGAALSGFSPEAILEAADLPAGLYVDPWATLDGCEFQRLFLTIQREMNDVFMGFLEQPGKPAAEVEQAKARHRCATFGEAIRISTQFREAVRNDLHYDYVLDNARHEFSLVVAYKLRAGVDERLFYWHRMMQIYKFYCWLVGKRLKLNRVSFTTTAPASEVARACYDVFNCEVRFDQPENSLTFDKRYLLYPVARSEAEAADFITKYPDWFEVAGEDRSWTRQVERVLTRLRQEEIWAPTISMVAKILSLSPRTLRRQLGRENETFQAIKSRLRCDQAIKLLVTSDLPITTIAAEIGFAEPGDFTRAFIGWTASTPSGYRAKHAGRFTVVVGGRAENSVQNPRRESRTLAVSA